MKKHSSSGLTLIEVILSLAIFAIISVGFLGMFSEVYINTYKSTKITEDAFLAQQHIEDQILTVKTSLNSGVDPTGLTSSTITLFTGSNLRNVIVYHLTQDINVNSTLDTYVSKTRPPKLQTPGITSGVSIAAYSGTTKQTYPNIGMTSLSVQLDASLVVDNPGLLVQYLYYWYVSTPGFYFPNNPPAFPDDYQIITNVTGDTISTIPASYAGRFIMLVVTPVGEKGQMGTSMSSNPIYISDMPLNANVVLHLDANYIKKSDTSQVRVVTSGSVTNYVKKWIDIGPLAVNLAQSTSNYQSILNSYTLGTGVSLRILQGSTGVSGSTSINLLSGTTPNVGSKANMTVYFAAKFEDTFPSSTLIFESKATAGAGGRWTFGTDANGKLVLNRYFTNGTTLWTLLSPDFDYRGSEWRVFKLEIWQNKLTIEIDGDTVGAAVFVPTTATTTTLQLTDFKINFDNRLSIGEVVVFDTSHLSTSSQAIAMYDYMNNKYKP